MDVAEFWQMIEDSRAESNGDNEQQFEMLVDALSHKSEEDLMEFRRIFYLMTYQANIANLWEAADVIACGCSDDGFIDFRCWLVAQGKSIFEAAIDDPETLADIVEVEHRLDVLYGRMVSAAHEAYTLRTGEEMPLVVYGDPGLVGSLGPEKLRRQKFPQLAAKFDDCE